jgi:bifunctional enzyme CysN/CysC
MAHDLLRFLTCGSVDDGKSTLIGRLLYDTQSIHDDQLTVLHADSKRFGTTGGVFDPALVTDGLKAEREQGITIDVAYRYFATPRRSFIIADTPGHEQYTRNMVTGASTSDVAVLLVDVRHGLQPQTRRHAAIAALLGIRHVILAINKMDLAQWDRGAFEKVADEFRGFASRLSGVDIQCLPIAALPGDNIVHRSVEMPWYQGSTLLHALETVQVTSGRNTVDLRLPVQLVCRPDAAFRGYQGTVASGTLRVGDAVVAMPSRVATTVRVIHGVAGDTPHAGPGEPVTVEVADALDISRGDVIVHARNQPRVDHDVEAMVVWMGGGPLRPGARLLIKHLTQTVPTRVEAIDYQLAITDLRREQGAVIETNSIGRCRLVCERPLVWDAFERNRHTGAAILIDPVTRDTVGAVMLIDRLAPHLRQVTTTGQGDGRVTAEERAMRLGHTGRVVWLTGLSGAGKTTIARAVERKLFDAGRWVVTLDGDDLRAGLNSGLGFTQADRSENIRRVAEVAKVLADAGAILLVPVIAPFAVDRARAKAIVGVGRFSEVFVDTPLGECESRDVKGMYRRARAGEIAEFTGVSSPYEAPTQPDLHLSTAGQSVEASAEALVDYIEQLLTR